MQPLSKSKECQEEIFKARSELTPTEYWAWKELMGLDDDESRLRVMRMFCSSCGASTVLFSCYCWNDE